MNCPQCSCEQIEGSDICHNCGYKITLDTNVKDKDASDLNINYSRVKAPEFAMMWSLLFSPLIGSIFWTRNWIRLEKRKYIWWTWASAVIIILLSVIATSWLKNQYIKYFLNIAWVALIYVIQRRLIPKEKKSISAIIISGLILLITVVVVSGKINTWLERSGSMLPTIRLNDRVFAEKINKDSIIKRGDVVVLLPPAESNINGVIISRVIGLPGEKLSVHDGKVFISGQPLNENYIANKPSYSYPEVKIPENNYFVMGDNRNNSKDSHVWGFLPQNNISSRILMRYWPLNSIGRLAGQGPIF